MSTPPKLQRLFARRGKSTARSSTFARQLAVHLQWGKDGSSLDRINNSAVSSDTYIGSVEGQPLLLFSGDKNSSPFDRLSNLGLFAYHRCIPWGVISNREHTLVFNSHRLVGGRFFHFDIIPFGAAAANAQLLEALSPEAALNGLLEELATHRPPPDHVLLPVDDALVDALDLFRDDAVAHSASPDRDLDANLQLLFSQLFLLRAIEDRRLLSPPPPSLESTRLADAKSSLQALDAIFSNASQLVEKELFSKKTYRQLPLEVVQQVIFELYSPRHLLPINGRYNFAWISADVLGRAYEKYLSTLLDPVPNRRPQQGLWEGTFDAKRRSIRKSQGVFYTPPQIVKFLTRSAVDRWQSEHPNTLPKIADISCGSGSFLVEALDLLLAIGRKIPRFSAKRIIEKRLLLGIDIDPRAVQLARLALWLRFAEEPSPLPLPQLSEIVVCGDTLSAGTWKTIPDEFDIIVGNPPFLSTSSLPKRADMVERFQSARGRFDISSLFVETGLKRLTEGGLLSLVVPNRLFSNRDAEAARGLISRGGQLLSLVDFGSRRIFADASAYTGLLIARRTSAPDRPPLRCIVFNEDFESQVGPSLGRASRLGITPVPGMSVFEMAHPAGDAPWMLLSPEAKSIRARIELSSVALGDIALVRQGIKTGANDIFVLRTLDTSPSIGTYINGLGDTVRLESAVVRPCVFGGEIERYRRIESSDTVLIFPYKDGVALEEGEFSEQHELAYAYLRSYKPMLASRSGVKDEPSKKWYELTRQREEEILARPKLIMRDLATRSSFALNETGGLLLIGGTAVVPESSVGLLQLLGVLNSTVVDEFLKSLTPGFRASFQKFEPRHIERTPVPQRLIDDVTLGDRIDALVRKRLQFTGSDSALRRIEDQIDQAIRKALELSSKGVQ